MAGTCPYEFGSTVTRKLVTHSCSTAGKRQEPWTEWRVMVARQHDLLKDDGSLCM